VPYGGAVAELLPLFPLGHVLMPGCPLPLRIFEPRYQRLLADVTAPQAARHFGVVALTSGLEVDTGLNEAQPRLADVGTLAEILEVHPADDGTVRLLTGGGRRFRIERLVDSGTPYLQAEVSYLPEVVGELPAGLASSARALAGEYVRLVAGLTGTAPELHEPYPTDDPILLSYRLATETPMAQADKQSLLEDETATARFLHVQRVLRRELKLLRSTRSVAVSPAVLQIARRPN
jgi:uncharacterized protein